MSKCLLLLLLFLCAFFKFVLRCNKTDKRNLKSLLTGKKTPRFPWYLMLVSANHASSKPGLVVKHHTDASVTLA